MKASTVLVLSVVLAWLVGVLFVALGEDPARRAAAPSRGTGPAFKQAPPPASAAPPVPVLPPATPPPVAPVPPVAQPQPQNPEGNLANAIRQHEDVYLFNGAYTKMLRGAYVEAGSDFDALLLKFPASRYAPEALYFKGVSLAEAGQLEAAMGVFRLLTEEKKESPYAAEAQVKLGEILERLNRIDEAIATYDRFVHANPNAPQTVVCQQRIAGINERRGEYPQAIQNWNASQLTANRVFPNDVNETWYFQRAQNRLAFLQSNNDFGGEPLRLYNEGIAHARAQRLAEAGARFKEILDRFPKAKLVDLARLQLATCERLAGRVESAAGLLSELSQDVAGRDAELRLHAQRLLEEVKSASAARRPEPVNAERQSAK